MSFIGGSYHVVYSAQVVSVPLMVGPGAYAVTGGTGALGLCVARRLVEEGAKVPGDPLLSMANMGGVHTWIPKNWMVYKEHPIRIFRMDDD